MTDDDDKIRITGDDVEKKSSEKKGPPPPPPPGKKAKSYVKPEASRENTVKITWTDLDKTSSPVKGSSSPSGTKGKSYGKVSGAAGKAASSSSSLTRQSWFYLALAGIVGALLGWGLTEPSYEDARGAQGTGGVLDEFNRRLNAAGAQTGKITLSLMWHDYNDLDLHCKDPTGEKIYYSNKRGKHGTLDVDRNVSPTTQKPVENIFFANPTSGRYEVYVHHFNHHASPVSQSYVARVTVSGQRKEFSGSVTHEDPPKLVHSFDYIDDDSGDGDDLGEANAGEGFGNLAMIPLVLAFACLGFGVAESVVERSAQKAFAKGGLALVLGLAFGFVAYQVANGIYGMGGDLLHDASASSLSAWLLRGFSWVVFGIAAGLIYGIIGQSGKKCLYGCLGGGLGAFLGGLLFNPIVDLTGGAEASRAIGFIVLGGATGISMGLVESALKDRWLHVISGPLAGKQFILYKDETLIGSHSKSDIYLFKDSAVDQTHAIIALSGANMVLRAKGETRVGGQIVREKTLASGDRIEIGQYGFRYEEKNKA
jgi:hypothetical protein